MHGKMSGDGDEIGDGVGRPPKCPRCGAVMEIVRVVPRAATFPPLNTLRCVNCGNEITVEVED
jgi:hypothetical protein